MKEYIEKIRLHLRDMIDDLKKSSEWKVNLTMKLNFISSTDSNENRRVYSKSDGSIVTVGNDTDKIIQERFDSLLHKHQIGLDQSKKVKNIYAIYVQFDKP